MAHFIVPTVCTKDGASGTGFLTAFLPWLKDNDICILSGG